MQFLLCCYTTPRRPCHRRPTTRSVNQKTFSTFVNHCILYIITYTVAVVATDILRTSTGAHVRGLKNDRQQNLIIYLRFRRFLNWRPSKFSTVCWQCLWHRRRRSVWRYPTDSRSWTSAIRKTPRYTFSDCRKREKKTNVNVVIIIMLSVRQRVTVVARYSRLRDSQLIK